MKILFNHWSLKTPTNNVVEITPTILRVKNDDKVVYTLYKADVNIEVETKVAYTNINITDFKTIKL